MNNHEKELIDYAAMKFKSSLMEANPFPINAHEQISLSVCKAIDAAAANMAIFLAKELKNMNESNQAFQARLAHEAAEERRYRARIVFRQSLLTAGPVALIVTILVEVAKQLLQ